ncbi:glycosyltransferase [Subtercola frigoramans]|uniref:Glycosyltransferase involved in cell wall biosynthesis n=1 Tax=Subtercola frigoramans TaxID=120298 RepID=A0ABS2L8S3_9MICO|nr:glycosyltransferase [Subtercola frigoramans]MBM7473389.1 glycosyltransferase involved in cell wall biosynthesis [Subtercola frigoramans]
MLVFRSIWLPDDESYIRAQMHGVTSLESVGGQWNVRGVGLRAAPLTTPENPAQILYPAGQFGDLAIRLFTATRTFGRLEAMVRRRRPAIIHAHSIADGILIEPIARRARVPLIVTAHSFDPLVHCTGMIGHRTQDLFDYVSVLIATTDSVKRALLSSAANPDRLVVHAPGVVVPGPVTAARGAADVAFVDEFDSLESFARMLRVIEGLPAGRRLTLLAVGDGAARHRAQGLAEERGHTANFVGAVSYAELPATLAGARVLVNTARTLGHADTSGVPASIFAAASVAVPAASFDYAEIRSVVADDDTGYLVSEATSRNLSHAVWKLAGQAGQDRALGANARRRIERDFNIDRQCALLGEIYASVA